MEKEKDELDDILSIFDRKLSKDEIINIIDEVYDDEEEKMDVINNLNDLL